MDKGQIYLEEIKEFCKKITGFMASLSYEDFLGDEKLQLAIIQLIQNIGEAAKRLSDETKARYSNVDWYKVVAMRNRLVHAYMDVDLAIVYDVAVNEVLLLLKNLE
mgnify:CR=1 FL=1